MDVSLLLAPISADSPAGADARYEPEYAALLEEVEKLNSITRSQECNWHVIEEMGQAVLSARAKDFQAGCYLAYALTHEHGLEGMADGAALLQGLVAEYWESGFPVLRRIRGRINALQWWQERTEAALDAELADTGRLHDPDLVQRLATAVRALDTSLAEKLPDLPSLRNLLDRIERLPLQAVAAAPEPRPVQEPETVQPQAQTQAAPVQQPQAPAQPVAPTAATAPSERLAAPAQLSDNAKENRQAFFDYALSLAEMERREDPTDPLSWQITRMSRWGRLRTLPPSQNKRTSIAAPMEEQRTALARLMDSGRYEQAALAAESLWPGHCYWLDAQYLIATCLKNLGSAYEQVRIVVCAECAQLVHRLPGLEELSFDDGLPFAGKETRQWLASLTSAQGQGREEKNDPAAETIAQARTLFASEQKVQALDLLDETLARCTDTEARLRLRLEQCRLLLRAQEALAATVLAEELLEEVRRLCLEAWSKDLALDILQTAQQAYATEGSREALEHSARVRRQLVRLRPSALL